MFSTLMRTSTLPRPTWLLLIAAVSILALYITTPGPAATPLVSRWRPHQLITQPDQPAHHPNPPPPAALNGAALPVDQFDISVDDGLYVDQRQALAGDLQRALNYDIARFGSGPTARFRAAVLLDASCGLHGIAYTDL